jgi:hypothetical protein
VHQIVNKNFKQSVLSAIDCPSPIGDPAGIEATRRAIDTGRKLEMIRKLKVLSLALGAVFAMGAVMASSASAVDVFTNDVGKGADILTGFSHDNVLKLGSASFECTTAKFAGTAKHGDTFVTAEPVYTGTPLVKEHTEHCLMSPGNKKITVDMNGCHYSLSGNTEVTEDGADAQVWITCPQNGKGGQEEIKITVPELVFEKVPLTISIPEQTPTAKKGGVVYDNLPTHAGGAAIKVTATVTGITYKCAPTFLCGLGGISTEGNNATYTGTVAITCYKDENELNKPITPAKEGAQTGCESSII